MIITLKTMIKFKVTEENLIKYCKDALYLYDEPDEKDNWTLEHIIEILKDMNAIDVRDFLEEGNDVSVVDYGHSLEVE